MDFMFLEEHQIGKNKITFRTFLCQINSLDDELHEPLLGVLRERRHALGGQGHGEPVLVVGLEKKPDKYLQFARNYFFKCGNVQWRNCKKADLIEPMSVIQST